VTLAVPAGLEDLTAGWVEVALTEGGQLDGPVKLRDVERHRIGQATGFLGHLARLTLDYAEPPGRPAAAGAADDRPRTVVAKLPTTDPGGRVVGGMLNVWQRESRFFVDLAPRCGPTVPRCWYNGADPAADRWALLLEDRGGGPAADQVRGANDDQATAAVETLARLQAPFWGRPPPVDWLPSFARPGFNPLQAAMASAIPVFTERHGDRVPPRTLEWLRTFVDALPAWAAQQGSGPLTLVHADYRLDNLLFAADGAVTVIDWQTTLFGPGPMDLASFLATSLAVPDRRRLEADLLDTYTATLQVGGGRIAGAADDAMTRAEVERRYRSCLLWWMAIFANNLSRIDPADERGRALFEHMIDRTFRAADDWDAGELLAELPSS
jgi:aminoglycoside phosphotransferase (APT) family kinase protein